MDVMMVNSTNKILTKMQGLNPREKVSDEPPVNEPMLNHTPNNSSQLTQKELHKKIQQCMPGMDGIDLIPHS